MGLLYDVWSGRHLLLGGVSFRRIGTICSLDGQVLIIPFSNVSGNRNSYFFTFIVSFGRYVLGLVCLESYVCNGVRYTALEPVAVCMY